MVESDGFHTLIVNDISGREVYGTKLSNRYQDIDLGSVGKGVYVVRLMGVATTSVSKVVVE